MSFKRIKGALASGHPMTTWAGHQMFNKGGNAYDAICASAFTACVTEPLLTSLGGGGIMMAKDDHESPIYGLDFFVNFPGLNGLQKKAFEPLEVRFSGESQTFQTGKATVAVPGTLKGLLWIIENKCRLNIQDIVAPAIELASQGVKITQVQSYTMDLLQPILSVCQTGKEIFYHNQNRLKTNDVFRNLYFADFLEKLCHRESYHFYHGELKNRLLDEFKPGHLSKADIEAYGVQQFNPVVFEYHGIILNVPAKPCLGGFAVKDLLDSLAKDHLENTKLDDPKHLTKLANSLKNYEQKKQKPFQKGTTHISACDENGAVVSMSLTNGEGCGYFLSKTGIMLNNMLGEDDLCDPSMSDWIPGTRMPSMMCPMIIETDHPIAIGAGGSKRIRSSLAQIINLHIDHKVELQESIEYPRINFDGTTFQVEPGHDFLIDEKILNHDSFNIWSSKEFYFGGVNAVKGINIAYGDSRRGGHGIISN